MADAPDVSIAGVAFVGPVTAPGPGRDPCGGLAQRVKEVGGDGVVDEEMALCGEVFELLVGEHGSSLPGGWQKMSTKAIENLNYIHSKRKELMVVVEGCSPSYRLVSTGYFVHIGALDMTHGKGGML